MKTAQIPITPPCILRFLCFDPERYAQGRPACKIEIEQEGKIQTVWMTRKNLETNIERIGENKALVSGLNGYLNHTTH